MSKRPLSITAIGCAFICVGCVSLVAGVSRFIGDLAHPGPRGPGAHDLLDLAFVTGSALLAAGAGAFVLRGRTWARWLCAAWLGFHVILSIAHPINELAVHSLLFVGISYLIFRPQVSAYFRGTRAEPP